MIPSDVATRLQLTADAAVARAPTVQQVSDALADLVPGQRVLAEITSRLPTGAYRALINQRDVTLALPFSAKAGDALELEVVENGGRLMLAVVARKEAEPGGGQAPVNRPAAETILSRAGSLISGLMAKPEDGEPAKPAQLNANQPIANAPPARGAELVPLLRQAITQSGMFYESHQVQWATNRLPVEALLVQPQGRLSPALLAQEGATAGPQGSAQAVQNPQPANAASMQRSGATDTPANTVETARPSTTAATIAASTQAVAPDTVPIVQQQLEALATQTYVWQGQAWPGQTMRWEIEEDARHRESGESGEPDVEAQWQTRLTLTMPLLGEVRAAVRLSGSEITLGLISDNDEAAVRLSSGGDALREQMAAAGLDLASFVVSRHERTEG